MMRLHYYSHTARTTHASKPTASTRPLRPENARGAS